MTKLTTEQIKRQKALAWLKRVAYENPCMKEVKTCIEVLSAPAQPVIQDTKYSYFHDWLKGQNLYAYQVASGELEASEDEVINAKATIMDMSIGWKAAIQFGSQPVIPRELRSFVTDADIAALHRFAECCDDPESGGHDLEKEQVQRLEKIGALQRSGRISYITDFGDYLISVAPAQESE